MEIRTCEDYVVNKLIEAEDIIDNQRLEMHHLLNRIEELEADIDKISKLASVEIAYDGSSKYVKIDGPWFKHEPEQYDEFVRILHLEAQDNDAEVRNE